MTNIASYRASTDYGTFHVERAGQGPRVHTFRPIRRHRSAGSRRTAASPASGRITATGHVPTGGKTPRNFAVGPTGTRLYAANQDGNTLVHFDVDPVTGQLRPNGDVIQVGAPVCVLFSS